MTSVCTVLRKASTVVNVSSKLYPSSMQIGEYYTNFIKCISGYHMINTQPIKSDIWKCLNTQILEASKCKTLGKIHHTTSIHSKAKSSFKISSHHLTSVSSFDRPGNISTILNEIHRRNDFDFLSILLRNNHPGMKQYDWYLIPKSYHPLNPFGYSWKPMIGKRGSHHGEIIGWETNTLDGSSMSITFNMSSQLWLNLALTEELKKYRIASTIVNPYNKYNYIQLYNELLILSGKPKY